MKRNGKAAVLFVASAMILILQAESYCADPSAPVVPTWPPKGSSTKVQVTRDNWLSAVGQEASGNNGGSDKMKLKGQQELSIFDFDAKSLKGKIVTGAIWHVRCVDTKNPLKRVSVSTISSDWVEGKGGGSYAQENGSSCFAQAEFGKRDWSYPGSSILDVIMGKGNTIWRFAEASPPDGNNWQDVPVSPDVVAANIAGLSYGCGAIDDVGSEWSYIGNEFKFTYFPNRFINSKDSGKNAPWLEVWTDGTDSTPPPAVADITADVKNLPAGQALVKWKTPADTGGAKTLGFNVSYAGSVKGDMPRYLIPMAGKPGQEVAMLIQDIPFKPGESVELTICAVDSAGNVGAPFKKAIKVSDTSAVFKIAPTTVKPFDPSTNLPAAGSLKVAIVDMIDKIDPKSGEMSPSHPDGYKGGNHLWSGTQKLVRLQGGKNEFVHFQVNLEGSAGDVDIQFAMPSDKIATTVYRFDYVKSEKGSVGDILVPMKGKVKVPYDSDSELSGAKNMSFLCQAYVPHGATSGAKSGTLKITADGKTLEIKVDLTVWDFTLPNKLSFVPEMNAYGTVSVDDGIAYYRLAHENRTCANRLYYNWNGNQSMFSGTSMNLSEMNSKYAPLFNGSAFKDLPRSGEPVDVFYLPFNEAWPVPCDQYYKKNYWADEAFDPAYKKAMQKAFAELAANCNAKKWHDTVFQYYLNNKVYYKGQNKNGWKGCSALWIFDEPVNMQDFWALRWYGIVWHEAVLPVKGNAKMTYRADVSYSQYDRNTYWGLMDIEVLGGTSDQKIRMKRDEKFLWNDCYFQEYGSANYLHEPNVQPVVWCINAWSRGAFGVLPWQTIGAEKNFSEGDQLALMVPKGKDVFASVRLKAFCRGQQDTEYFTLLCDTQSQPQFAIAGGIAEMVDLRGKVIKKSESDAGTMIFDKADPVDLWKLRVSVGEMVSAKKPPYKRALRELPMPKIDLTKLPDIGYVEVAPKYKPSGPDMK